MVRQRSKTIKGHKTATAAEKARERSPDHIRGSSLDALKDKDLGRCARIVIEQVLRPGLRSTEAIEAATCRHILDQLVVATGISLPHAGTKWRGNNAIRLHAMVYRRWLRNGRSMAKAYRDIADNHVLPVDALLSPERQKADDPVDVDTVKKTHGRALKHLEEYLMRDAVERLVQIECARQSGTALPSEALHVRERELPEPILPPDFRRRNAAEPPEWEPDAMIERYLMARHDARALRDAGTEKT